MYFSGSIKPRTYKPRVLYEREKQKGDGIFQLRGFRKLLPSSVSPR